MKYLNTFLRVGLVLALLLVSWPLRAFAASAPAMAAPTGLSIMEIKVTGSEYVVLQNNTGADISDLSSYALYYFNNYNPFASGVSSSTSFLPATGLANGESLLLSGDPRQTCGAVVAGDLGLSLGDSSGFLEVVQLSSSNGAVVQQAGDVVSWSSGANGLIQNVPSNTKDPAAMWYRYQTSVADNTYGWQYADIDAADPCQLNANITSGTTKTTAPASGLLANSGDTVPGTIISLSTISGSGSAGLPAADIGLKSPKMSELLANVASPGTDAEDEFIELYNPNGRAFDLSGFSLQTGSTTSTLRHNYVFPAGTKLPANGFKAFYSKQTHLSLSNTGGQAWLRDPFGTAIAQSDPYSKPKDGIAWATVNGRWYYTTMPTPGAANAIKAPFSASVKGAKASAKTSRGTAVTALNTSGNALNGAGSSAGNAAEQIAPLHPLTLAVVLGLALLYGAYEYRRDIANRFSEFRSHRRARAEAR